MTNRKKIILISLGLLLIPVMYGLFESFNLSPEDERFQHLSPLAFPIIMMIWIVVEYCLLLLVSLIQFVRSGFWSKRINNLLEGAKRDDQQAIRDSAISFFLASALLILIGGSICFGGTALVESIHYL
jgi:hypothetical protein